MSGRIRALALALAVVTIALCGIVPVAAQDREVREPAVAGGFYPAGARELAKQVAGCLSGAGKEPLDGDLLGLVVPHAGYIYSGPVAAHAYKQLEGRHYDTVVLVGSSHHVRFEGVSVGNYAAYRTPLGDVPVAADLAAKLIESSELIRFRPLAHRREHSLEVQLPFLQAVMKDFRILPIITGDQDLKTFQHVAAKVREAVGDENVLWIASTDLSHYMPYRTAVLMDRRTVAGVMTMTPEEFHVAAQKGTCDLCGSGAVVTMMAALAGREPRVKLLKYANSGDTAGGKGAVVGYAAIAFCRPAQEEAPRGEQPGPLPGLESDPADLTWAPLDEKSSRTLLKLARQAIETYVTREREPNIEPDDYPSLAQKRGVFVTINKGGKLRGCVGCHASDEPLCRVVPVMAISSACRDRRFKPLTRDELADISIELSVYLSPLIPIDGAEDYEPGRHGIVMKFAGRSATFLPEVPTERGWTREQTLRALCLKAGLVQDAWRTDGVRFFVYRTQKIQEGGDDE